MTWAIVAVWVIVSMLTFIVAIVAAIDTVIPEERRIAIRVAYFAWAWPVLLPLALTILLYGKVRSLL